MTPNTPKNPIAYCCLMKKTLISNFEVFHFYKIMYFVLLFQVNGLKLSLEGAYREMEQLRKSLSEKEDLAQEEALIKETQARQALQEQLREQQDQHREETDRLLRYVNLVKDI